MPKRPLAEHETPSHETPIKQFKSNHDNCHNKMSPTEKPRAREEILNKYLLKLANASYIADDGQDALYQVRGRLFGDYNGIDGTLDKLAYYAVKSGANPNATDMYGLSALELFYENPHYIGSFKMCRTLLQNGATPNKYLLDRAIKDNNPDMARLLVGFRVLENIQIDEKLNYLSTFALKKWKHCIDDDSFKLLSNYLWDNCETKNPEISEKIAQLSRALAFNEDFIFKQDEYGRTPLMLMLYKAGNCFDNLRETGLLSVSPEEWDPRVELKDKDGHTAQDYYSAWEKEQKIFDILLGKDLLKDFGNAENTQENTGPLDVAGADGAPATEQL
ncbi:MAG: hypothetical protein KA998_02175 [Rickettsiaceae bacterium]|nr:hypothetical protein [Rickettsiaceae bacterium]